MIEETIIGLLAAGSTMTGMVYQIYKMYITGDTKALSYNLSVFFIIGFVLWAGYGAYLHNLIIMVPNLLGIIIMTFMITIKFRNEQG